MALWRDLSLSRLRPKLKPIANGHTAGINMLTSINRACNEPIPAQLPFVFPELSPLQTSAYRSPDHGRANTEFDTNPTNGI